jgi:hypothetical protein
MRSPQNFLSTTGRSRILILFKEGDGKDRIHDFDRRRHENDHGFDRGQLDVRIGTNPIDDLQELQSLIARGDIGVSARKMSLTLIFDNGDALALAGVRELSADDWLVV